MFCHNNKAFLLCLPKRFSRSRLKKGRSGSRLRLHPKSAAPGGSGSATLIYLQGAKSAVFQQKLSFSDRLKFSIQTQFKVFLSLSEI